MFEIKEWIGMVAGFVGLLLLIVCLVAIPVGAIMVIGWGFVEGVKSIIGMF